MAILVLFKEFEDAFKDRLRERSTWFVDFDIARLGERFVPCVIVDSTKADDLSSVQATIELAEAIFAAQKRRNPELCAMESDVIGKGLGIVIINEKGEIIIDGALVGSGDSPAQKSAGQLQKPSPEEEDDD
jgi:hypothetical protein